MSHIYFYLGVLFIISLVVAFIVVAIKEKKSAPKMMAGETPPPGGEAMMMNDPQAMDMTDLSDAGGFGEDGMAADLGMDGSGFGAPSQDSGDGGFEEIDFSEQQ